MIATKEHIIFAVDEQYFYWCTVGPLFNKTKFQNIHGLLFEELFVTALE